jgi:hypothetical protein
VANCGRLCGSRLDNNGSITISRNLVKSYSLSPLAPAKKDFRAPLGEGSVGGGTWFSKQRQESEPRKISIAERSIASRHQQRGIQQCDNNTWRYGKNKYS